MAFPKELTDLKTNIAEKIGQRIIVRGAQGRSKFFEKEAIIQKTYPNFFMIKYDNEERDVTCSYQDVVDSTVAIDVYDGEGYSPLIPPTVDTKKIRNL